LGVDSAQELEEWMATLEVTAHVQRTKKWCQGRAVICNICAV
jgi:hypothetical protein